MRDLASLPKGHLHLHLEGAMRPTTLAELAAREGIPVPPIRGFGSFSAFADMYLAACAVLRTPEDLARVTREVVADAVGHGAVWIEPSFYPANRYTHLGSDEEVARIVLAAGAEAAAAAGVGFGLMISADRTARVEEAVGLAELAVALKGAGVVSFGLANDETLGPPAPFAPAFELARAGGLLCAPHAGELSGPESVRDALDLLHADRLQHGVRAVEDPALLKELAARGTCLDVCPSSNVLLSVFPSLEAHVLPKLLEAGVRCSLNSDDPLLFGPGLLEEYELCRSGMGLDDEALAAIARSSIACSGAPEDLKARRIADIDAWLEA